MEWKVPWYKRLFNNLNWKLYRFIRGLQGIEFEEFEIKAERVEELPDGTIILHNAQFIDPDSEKEIG